MSWSERYVQDHKRRTDCAVHRACAQLASDPPTFETFQELLTCSRKRAPCLFEAPVFDGRHPGIDALVNLSRFRAAHIRPAIEWAGTSSSWRLAVSSMAHHLVCDYQVECTGTWFTFWTGHMVYNPLAVKVALVEGLRLG
jgi:hypothetical protein